MLNTSRQIEIPEISADATHNKGRGGRRSVDGGNRNWSGVRKFVVVFTRLGGAGGAVANAGVPRISNQAVTAQ